ncbi:MAG: hypothetical protein HDR20_09485 [Lachnospiraceae bacterium]|nr:hypothetical protein [Lachnospiraceae bacterium]
MMKLRKMKKLIAVFAMMAAMLIPSAFAYAVEISEDTMEVAKDEKRHTVAVYGKAVAVIYPEGQMVIVANNPSGRVDVMLDGKVSKGIGTVVIPAENRTNMVLEEGSLVVNVTEEDQADALMKMITESLLEDQPIKTPIKIESEEEVQNVKAYIVGKGGEILTEDGTKAAMDELSGVKIKTSQTAYKEFAAAMEEKIQEEIQEEQEKIRQEEQEAEKKQETENKKTPDGSQNNGISGVCSHEWEPAGSIVGGEHDGAPTYKCKKCGIRRI